MPDASVPRRTSVPRQKKPAVEWRTNGPSGVVPAELFLDLVFAFCLMQITRLVGSDLHWLNMLRGLLMTLIIWTIWVGFAWIGNLIPPGERPSVDRIGLFRILLIMAMDCHSVAIIILYK